MEIQDFSRVVNYWGKGVAIGGPKNYWGTCKNIGGDNFGEIRMAYLAYRILAKRGDSEIRKIRQQNNTLV